MSNRTSSSLPDRLLILAAQFTRHNDTLAHLALVTPETAAALPAHIASAQRLARATVETVDGITGQRLERTPDVNDVLIRLRQIAFLTNAAVDHFIDAEDILTTAGDVASESPDVYDQYHRRDVLLDAGRQLHVARDLTALAPESSAQAAETLTLAAHRQHLDAPTLPGPEITLSRAQDSALRAIARGQVQIYEAAGRQRVTSHDERLLLTTLRSLESKQLIQYNLRPDLYDRHRVRLTATGRQTLIANYGRPQKSALTTKAVPKAAYSTASSPATRPAAPRTR
ncbi:hypothetical protein [Streptomyces sp. AK02-01A]|uniref:hypothetical protein n=1 Tax=Streptomyces sp. AK02-01A TaxID=3028648 RepID=UPI0029BA90BB|nr:hypothetical protein [Streptomyces sp. AK02-01A]MDX3855901.1 hypothetical protein [Streptomyces sp. AK02-01A]